MMRWGKAPKPTGLARVADAGRYRDDVLRRDGEIVARVSRTGGGFYFYGLGRNTLTTPWEGRNTWPTAEEAKAACVAFIRSLPAPSRGDRSTGTGGEG